jgi:hypothetical protein
VGFGRLGGRKSYKESTIGDSCLLDYYGNCEAKFPKM